MILRSAWVAVFALLTVAGLVAFGAHVAGMLRRRRLPAVTVPSPDYAVWHTALAFGWLAIAAALGLVLAVKEPSDLTLRIALAYGVFGLVGFLAQIIAGLQLRLLPLLGWFTAVHRGADMTALASPHATISSRLSCAAWVLWLWGVPAVAVGFFLTAIPLLTAGALALEAAVAIGALQAFRVARYAFTAMTANDCRRSTGNRSPESAQTARRPAPRLARDSRSACVVQLTARVLHEHECGSVASADQAAHQP
jgi:hypothetical protein